MKSFARHPGPDPSECAAEWPASRSQTKGGQLIQRMKFTRRSALLGAVALPMIQVAEAQAKPKKIVISSGNTVWITAASTAAPRRWKCFRQAGTRWMR
ncbi:hypothetical protein SBA3_120006 [Candidatus Sulfopaludibacter sp. SbA3]|nr:hypothetical protein SBA3_120006 [Candidatus Sulfopaludibacter sp. SbA3]